jgi:uncharacterized protein with PIN domain
LYLKIGDLINKDKTKNPSAAPDARPHAQQVHEDYPNYLGRIKFDDQEQLTWILHLLATWSNHKFFEKFERCEKCIRNKIDPVKFKLPKNKLPEGYESNLLYCCSK